jgi:hypothetical protein
MIQETRGCGMTRLPYAREAARSGRKRRWIGVHAAGGSFIDPAHPPDQRADALSELTGTVLCADGPVTSLVGLSLAVEHRRGHGALYCAS